VEILKSFVRTSFAQRTVATRWRGMASVPYASVRTHARNSIVAKVTSARCENQSATKAQNRTALKNPVLLRIRVANDACTVWRQIKTDVNSANVLKHHVLTHKAARPNPRRWFRKELEYYKRMKTMFPSTLYFAM
jgi:hypothetical protein